MSSGDVTAPMLQMMKQMQEQELVAQEMMQEQQRAADERQRQLMAAILDRRACQTPTATRSTIGKSPPNQDRLQGVLRETQRLDNVVQGPPGSAIGAWMCRWAYENRGRRDETKPLQF